MAMFNLAIPDYIQTKKQTSTGDIFATTDFSTPPGAGCYLIWITSSVNTATITVNQGSPQTGTAQFVPLVTADTPLLSAIAPYHLHTNGAANPTATAGGTTGTLVIMIYYYRAGRLH